MDVGVITQGFVSKFLSFQRDCELVGARDRVCTWLKINELQNELIEESQRTVTVVFVISL